MNTKLFMANIEKDIIDRLKDIKGETMYAYDIGMELTMCENNNGSWYCSEKEAMDEISENFEMFHIIAEYMRENLGIDTNVMLDPELFHVQAMITLYDATFQAALSKMRCEDDEITIDNNFIREIKDELIDIEFYDVF